VIELKGLRPLDSSRHGDDTWLDYGGPGSHLLVDTKGIGV